MGFTESFFVWFTEIVTVVSTLTAFIYGLRIFFKKGMPLNVQSLTMAMACHTLSSIYHICQMLTSKTLIGGFTPAYLGKIGFYLFFIAASYGQLDRIIDDGSKMARPARYIGFIAPVIAVLLLIPNIVMNDISVYTKIAYFLVWIPAMISVYFNLKHSVIADMDFGFVKAIRPYNILATCLGFMELVCLTAWNYYNGIFMMISSVLFGTLCIATMIAAKKGVEKWKI